jgi:DNA-directed RNA polymerase specialized sigma subunit
VTTAELAEVTALTKILASDISKLIHPERIIIIGFYLEERTMASVSEELGIQESEAECIRQTALAKLLRIQQQAGSSRSLASLVSN